MQGDTERTLERDSNPQSFYWKPSAQATELNNSKLELGRSQVYPDSVLHHYIVYHYTSAIDFSSVSTMGTYVPQKQRTSRTRSQQEMCSRGCGSEYFPQPEASYSTETTVNAKFVTFTGKKT